MPTKSLKIDSAWKKAALVLAGAVCIFASWHFSKWGMANSAAVRAEKPEVAEFLTELSPDDPQTHYTAAVLLEKNFDDESMRKALEQFELATARAPENYLYWLDLGRARERNGDTEGAERALRRALQLAPNYSRVQWALGNALLRQGRVDEAFVEIRKAVAGDPTLFANPAAVAAWQFFNGDINAIRRAADQSSRFDGALAAILIRENRSDEAIEIWRGIPPEDRASLALAEIGTALASKLVEEKRFRDAAAVYAGLKNNDIDPQVGQITNGGFEAAVKPEGAGTFDWQIQPGLQPQIVLSSSQKHSGNNSLFLIFNSDGKEFRTVSQMVAVEPDTFYEFELFYRSEVKSLATFKWEVINARDMKQIAISEPMSSKPEFFPLHIRFKSSADGDGVIIRLVREGCGQVCATTGGLWFDDISLRRVER